MARVTVEDCVLRVPNRFELVKLAAQRAREVSAGASLTVDRDNDKNPVVALREIADETVDLEGLREGLVKSLQRVVDYDDSDEDIVELMAGEEEWLSKALAQSAVTGTARGEGGAEEVSREELLREAEKLFEDVRPGREDDD